MNKSNILISSKSIELSEHKTYLELVNRICYYNYPNANNVMLPFNEDSQIKAQSLIDMPVQGKYTVNSDGNPTFKGHEVSIDNDGEIIFSIENIGVHTEVFIKEDSVETADGEFKKLPCLFAKQKIWTLNKNVVAAVKRLYEENKLYSSWVISTLSYTYEDGIKTLNDYLFEANTFLGYEYADPAYGKSANVISLSTNKEEVLVAEALAKDILAQNKEKYREEELIMEKNKIKKKNNENINLASVVNETEDVETSPVEEETKTSSSCQDVEKNTSSLSMKDLHNAIGNAIRELNDKWGYIAYLFPVDNIVWYQNEGYKETEFDVYKYSVEEDSILVEKTGTHTLVASLQDINKVISEKDETLIQANATINGLTNEISELSKYRDAYEKAEADKLSKQKEEKIKALAKYVSSSNVFSEEEINSEEIQTLISQMDEIKIKSMIADRVVKDLNKKVETASVENENIKIALDSGKIADPYADLMSFIHG